MIGILFWVSLCICVASFLLFAAQILVQVFSRPTSPAGGGGAGGAAPQALDPVEAMKQMGKLAEAFAKAGPIATTAVLCAFFGVIAVVSSGAMTVG